MAAASSDPEPVQPLRRGDARRGWRPIVDSAHPSRVAARRVRVGQARRAQCTSSADRVSKPCSGLRDVSARTAGRCGARPAGRGDLRRGCRGGPPRPGRACGIGPGLPGVEPARRGDHRGVLACGRGLLPPGRLGAAARAAPGRPWSPGWGRRRHRPARRSVAPGAGSRVPGRRADRTTAARCRRPSPPELPRAERRRRTLSARPTPARPGRLLVRRPGRFGARALRRHRAVAGGSVRAVRRTLADGARSCRASARGAAPARGGPGRDGRSAATRHRPGRGARRSPPCPRGTGRGPPHRGCARGGCSPGSGPAAALRCGADRRTAKRTRPGRGPGARPTAVRPRPGRARRRTGSNADPSCTGSWCALDACPGHAEERHAPAPSNADASCTGSWWALEAACPVPARPNWGVAAATSVPGARCGNGPDGGLTPCRWAPVGGCAAASGRVAEVCPAKSGRSSPGCGSKSAAPPSWGGTRWVPVGGWPPARPYSGAAGWAPARRQARDHGGGFRSACARRLTCRTRPHLA